MSTGRSGGLVCMAVQFGLGEGQLAGLASAPFSRTGEKLTGCLDRCVYLLGDPLS
jgi:hypothetical protein